MNGDFLRFQSYYEDPLMEVINISGNKQDVANKQFDTQTGKEMHNDQMAEMMLKMGRDMNKSGKN